VAMRPAGNAIWYLYDPSKKGSAAWTEITNGAPPDALGACAQEQYPCFASALTYDERNQRTIVLTQESGNVLHLWSYNPVDNPWAKITTSGGTAAATNSGVHNQLHYDPGTGSIYLVDEQSHWPGTGIVRTLKINVDLGNPLPTGTQSSILTMTPTRAAST